MRRDRGSDPAETIRGLRQRALEVDASDLGLVPAPGHEHVWGVVMETGYPQAVATLVVFADGTTSLYFSNGGGVIGAGEHVAVRRAGEVLLSLADAHVHACVEVSDTPVPEVGRVRFYLRTFDGTLSAEAEEEDLGWRRHPLAPLFHAAHSVIAAIRESTAGS